MLGKLIIHGRCAGAGGLAGCSGADVPGAGRSQGQPPRSVPARATSRPCCEQGRPPTASNQPAPIIVWIANLTIRDQGYNVSRIREWIHNLERVYAVLHSADARLPRETLLDTAVARRNRVRHPVRVGTLHWSCSTPARVFRSHCGMRVKPLW